MKVRILQILTTFFQLTARLKNFLMRWLLVLGLKECLVECATVCIKVWSYHILSVDQLLFLGLYPLYMWGVLMDIWLFYYMRLGMEVL